MGKRFPGNYSGLTVAQAALLSFIRSEAAEDRTPSYREMADALSLSSVSGIARLIEGLVDRGYVRKRYAQERSITLIDPDSKQLDTAPIETLLAELKRRGVVLASAS